VRRGLNHYEPQQVWYLLDNLPNGRQLLLGCVGGEGRILVERHGDEGEDDRGKAWGSLKLVQVKLWATVVAALCVVVRFSQQRVIRVTAPNAR